MEHWAVSLFNNIKNKGKIVSKDTLYVFKEKQKLKPNKPTHVEKICSECGNNQAWYSNDRGLSWQCWQHKKNVL